MKNNLQWVILIGGSLRCGARYLGPRVYLGGADLSVGVHLENFCPCGVSTGNGVMHVHDLHYGGINFIQRVGFYGPSSTRYLLFFIL